MNLIMIPLTSSKSNLLTYSTTLEAFIESEDSSTENAVLSDAEGNQYGLFKLNKASINKVLKQGDMRELLKGRSKNKLMNVAIEEGYMMNLTPDRETLNDAKEMIFSNVGKTATGWIAVNINGRFSLPLSRQLIKTPLTPNMDKCPDKRDRNYFRAVLCPRTSCNRGHLYADRDHPRQV